MKKSKGMLTIEAALVMPLVIYIVFIMISLFLLVYTRTYVATSTNQSVALATSQWYSNGSDFDVSTSKSSVIGEAIGTRISTNEKVKVLKEKIETKIQKGSPIEIEALQVKVQPENYIIGQKLEVEVSSTYRLPLSGLFKLLGVSEDGTFTDKYIKVVNLSNSEDNMRTITYASKIIKKGETSILDKIENALLGGS